MSYKGRYIAKNPKKYRGNPRTIIYRSLWERKFMVYCDTNESVLNGAAKKSLYPIYLLGMEEYIDIFQIFTLK